MTSRQEAGQAKDRQAGSQPASQVSSQEGTCLLRCGRDIDAQRGVGQRIWPVQVLRHAVVAQARAVASQQRLGGGAVHLNTAAKLQGRQAIETTTALNSAQAGAMRQPRATCSEQKH